MGGIRRTYQGSSIVKFIVISTVLIFLLVGSVYFLKQHGQQVRKDQAIAIYDKQQADEKSAKAELAKQTMAKENSSTNSIESTANSETLPVTGPESIIIQLIEIGLLTFFATSYLMSRRNLIHSLDL